MSFPSAWIKGRRRVRLISWESQFTQRAREVREFSHMCEFPMIDGSLEE